MSRSVRLTGYCIIWVFTLLPLLTTAQDKSLAEMRRRLDSLSEPAPEAITQEVTVDESITDTTTYADYAEDEEEDTTTVAAPPKQHYLWDQEIPISADSLDEYEYYEGGGLVLRKVSATLLKELNADKKLQYDRKQKEREKKDNERTKLYIWLLQFIDGIFRLLHAYRWAFIIIIASALVGLLLGFLKKRGFSFNFRKGDKEEVAILSDEELDFDTYEKQIQEAIAGNRLRLAVRLLYLQTLRLLADKEIISYSKEKTNAAYLRAMAQTAWYKAFANLTLDYEYIWYGEVPVNEAQFNVIHRHFSQFMNELGYTR